MARIRSVKPEFWTDPDVVDLPMAARLLFIGSWNHADDFGVLPDDPRRLKLQVLPADDVDAEAMIDLLVERGLLLRRVTPAGDRVLVVRTFCIHQRIDKRAVGRWGHPDTFHEHPTEPDDAPTIPTDPAQSRAIPTDPAPGLEGTGLEGTGAVNPVVESAAPSSTALVLVTATPPAPDPVTRVFDAWREATGHDRAKLSPDRRKRIRRWLDAGYTPDDLADACRGVTLSGFHQGDNDRHTVYDDLSVVLKDSRNIERFMDLARNGPPPARRKEPKSADAVRRLAQGGDL